MDAGESAPAPSYSSTRTPVMSEPEFLKNGQLTVDGEPEVPPPSFSDAHHGVGDSTNGFSGLTQADEGGEAPNRDFGVRENISATGYNSYDDGHDEAAAPTESKVDPRGSSDPGVSTTYDAEESPGFSMIGGDFSYDEDLMA
ncbi:hypothetical protein R6Q59_035185 [Mikania micrantha]